MNTLVYVRTPCNRNFLEEVRGPRNVGPGGDFERSAAELRRKVGGFGGEGGGHKLSGGWRCDKVAVINFINLNLRTQHEFGNYTQKRASIFKDL